MQSVWLCLIRAPTWFNPCRPLSYECHLAQVDLLQFIISQVVLIIRSNETKKTENKRRFQQPPQKKSELLVRVANRTSRLHLQL